MENTQGNSPLTQFNAKYLESLAFASRENAEKYRIAITAPKDGAIRTGDAPLNEQELERLAQGATWADIKAKREQVANEEVVEEPKPKKK